MQVNTTITVTRGDDEIVVDVTGTFERYGSANPYERGLSLADWDACERDTGKTIALDTAEKDAAAQALYDAL